MHFKNKGHGSAVQTSLDNWLFNTFNTFNTVLTLHEHDGVLNHR